MNQTFSLNRFGRLLRTYFTENRGSLLASVAVLTAILLLLSVMVYSQSPVSVEMNRLAVFILVGAAAWHLFTVQQVSMLNDKERAIAYLLRPVSTLEKWLQVVLVSTVGFLFVYLLLFTLIDAVGTWIYNHRTWTPEELRMTGRVDKKSLRIDLLVSSTRVVGLQVRAILAWALVLQALTLTLSLIIRRYSVTLVPVLIILGIFLLSALNRQILNGMLGNSERSFSAFPLSDALWVQSQREAHTVTVAEPVGSIIRYAVVILIVVLLQVSVFFRLKEREV